jgi:predicted nucleic acid-binding protein
MVDFVVDNSVAVAWLYPGQATPYTEHLLERSTGNTLHTAFIWPAEFANAASVMVKRGLLTDDLGSAMIQTAETFGFMVDRAPADLIKLYQISRQHSLSVYDAAYLELAMRLGIPLATRDKVLAAASQSLDLYLR